MMRHKKQLKNGSLCLLIVVIGGMGTIYGAVLGWTFEPGRIDDGWAVQGCQPMSGVAGGAAQTVTVPMWNVTDVEAAVARVREAGGSVIDEPSRQPYGMSALCVDDQGARFYLGS